MDSLNLLFHRNRGYLALLITLILFAASFSIVMPLSFALAVDILLPQAYRHHLYILIGGVLALAAVRFFLNLVQDYLFQKLRMNAESNIISRFSRAVIQNPNNPTLTQQNINAESWLRLWTVNFQYQFSEVLYFFAYAVFIAGVVFAIMFWIDPFIALLTLSFAVLHFINFAFHNSRSMKQASAYSHQKALFMSDIGTVLDGKRAINVAQIGPRIEANLLARADTAFRSAYQREAISNSQGFFQSILRGALFVSIISYAYPLVATGDMQTGALFITLLLVGFAFEPLYRLNKVTKLFNQMMSCLRPLSAIINHPHPVSETSSLKCDPKQISLNNVELSTDKRVLLKGLTITLKRGKVYLLKGPTGSGKTSLLKIISGLECPKHGAVLWDAANPFNLPQLVKAQYVSIATQSSLLFENTVAENISVFESNPDEHKIASLLTELGLSEKCADMHAVVSPEHFSTGQLQRLALARALYKNSSIVILDEPTANLDPETEAQCLKVISAKKESRVTILVSHGEQAKTIADEIIDLGGLQSDV